ncbi:hypothetical protein U1708_08240 [Sphingomonas sp. ZB1N12]|uniref:DUF7668 domain-containing protein n=1 Tax=Sphingomonas arabinosi TaxID=3096160 RepID=UPI002FCB76A7
MLPVSAEVAIQQMIVAVSAGDYLAALSQAPVSRCSVADIARVVSEYGERFSAPPFANWDVVSILSDGTPRWSVRAPLWSESENGRSDLELNLTISLQDGITSLELDDIRVA